jgi:hypothetical protein
MASSITSVAKSLYQTHPNSYFLIDRDHHVSDEKIEEYWTNFPDPNTSNLLVWRRRELENYFLEPSFLIESSYCKENFKANNGQQLQEQIVLLASERLYLDVANYTIVSLREDFFKECEIEKFSRLEDFADKKSAVNQLTKQTKLQEFAQKISLLTTEEEIVKRFQKYLDKMTGGQEPLQWGVGDWLSMISGKKVFRSLVNQCFQIHREKQGLPTINRVARELLLTGQNLPGDFLKLKELIDKRVKGR